MCAAKRVGRLASWGCLAWLALVGSGCAVTNAPPGWLQGPKDVPNGRGGWIAVSLETAPPERRQEAVRYSRPARWDLEGELLAVKEDSLFVLSGSSFCTVPWERVRMADLTGYDPQAGLLGVWTMLGMLSTTSHGMALIYSAPTWFIFGVSSTAAQSQAGHVRHPSAVARDFAPYARFPQGLPPGIDRAGFGRGEASGR